MNGHIVAFRVHRFQGPGDRVDPLVTSFEHGDVQKRHVCPRPSLEEFAVLRGDGEQNLPDILPVHERFDSPQPDGPSVEIGKDLLLLRVPKSARNAPRRAR